MDELLAAKQSLARQPQPFALLQGISPELPRRLGRSLFDEILAAEGDLPAEEASRKSPEYLREALTRRFPPGKPQ